MNYTDYLGSASARDNRTKPDREYVYALGYHTVHDVERRAKGITSPDSVFYFRRAEDRAEYRRIWSQLGSVIEFKEWEIKS